MSEAHSTVKLHPELPKQRPTHEKSDYIVGSIFSIKPRQRFTGRAPPQHGVPPQHVQGPGFDSQHLNNQENKIILVKNVLIV